jgi:hypothetical protein
MSSARETFGPFLSFLRLDNQESSMKFLLGTMLGIIGYIVLYLVDLPSFKVMGLLTIQINLALLVIPIVAVFYGPLAGFLVGLLGTLSTDALFIQQVIAFGAINLSYALLGFIIGIPHYAQGGGFSRWRRLIKLFLFTLAGFVVMSLLYVASLLLIVGQNILSALLYNFLPFFSVSLITLLIVSPAVVVLADGFASHVRSHWR